MNEVKLSKGYKQTEVGVIPQDWEVKSLGDIGESLIGLTYKPTDVRSDGILVLRSSNIQEGVLRFDDNVFVEKDIPERIMVRRGDILVCVRNGSRDLIGKCAWIDDRCRGMTFGAFMAVFRSPFHNFVYHLFQSWVIKRQIHEHLGATINQITNKSLNSFEIPFPHHGAEQEAVAVALSDADALIASLEQLVAKKRQIKQGVIQELLTGKRRLPGFKGEWEEKPLCDLFDFSGGFTASRDQLSLEGACYLHYGDIHKSQKNFIDVQTEFQDIPKLNISLKKISPASLLSDGDVVFVDASEDDEGTSKHVVIINRNGTPFISGLHTIVGKSRTDELDHLYRRYCFQTAAVKRQFRFYSVGTKVSGISKSNIGRIILPVPSIKEQGAIATILSEMDAEIAALEAKLDKSRRTKQGMMQELLTGKVRLVDARSEPAVNEVNQPVADIKPHNWEFNETVLISVLVKKFGDEARPLGRRRYTKLLYLFHRHVEKKAEGFKKMAAGPYNPSTKYGGPEKIAQKSGYIRSHVQGNFPGFVASQNVAKAEEYFQKWYDIESLQWLERFRFEKTVDLGRLATVDMAMEDLKKAGKAVNLEGVKKVIRNNPKWEAKLTDPVFSDTNIFAAMKTCEGLFGQGE